MNLNKLLAVGRSFVGGKDTPGRFKMTTQNLLPDFGSGRRLSAAGPVMGCVSVAAPVPEVVAGVDAPDAVGVLPLGDGVVGVEPTGVASAESARVGAERSGEPMPSRRVSIDAVRVVRNDLTDSDLEVVSVSRSRVVAVPVGAQAPESGVAGGVWRQVVSRVFRDTRVGV